MMTMAEREAAKARRAARLDAFRAAALTGLTIKWAMGGVGDGTPEHDAETAKHTAASDAWIAKRANDIAEAMTREVEGK